MKELAWNRFHSRRALRSPAHITLVPPLRLSEQDRDVIENRITSIAAHTPRFDLCIRGVNGFPPRVIYADVMPHPTLMDLHHEIQSVLEQEKIGNSLKVYPFRPHVTLAFRDLAPDRYPDALSFFQELDLQFHWPVHRISRLRHYQDHWKVDHAVYLHIQP